jgi:Flp pilus assembly pilin Flp
MNEIEFFCILIYCISLLIIIGISSQENHIVIALGNIWSKIGDNLKEQGIFSGHLLFMIKPHKWISLTNDH